MSDNSTVMSYLNAVGCCKYPKCNDLAHEIWQWAISHNLCLSAARILGVNNGEVDQLSRKLNLDLEWMLSPPVFQNIQA